MTSVLGSFFQKIAEGAREKHSLSPVRTEKPRKMIGSQLTALLQRARCTWELLKRAGASKQQSPFSASSLMTPEGSQTGRLLSFADFHQLSATVLLTRCTVSQGHSRNSTSDMCRLYPTG